MMSDFGKAIGGFIQCLYWLVGIMAGVILILVGAIAWMVLR